MSMKPLATLKLWEENYRIGNVEAIIASIVKFGFNGVLRVWKGGVVIAGNHALTALQKMKELGVDPPRGIIQKGDDWTVPTIDVSHLDDLEAKAFAVADNRTSELAENDPDKLWAVLKEVDAAGMLVDVGYDEESMAAIAEQVSIPPVDDDDFKPTEPPAETPPKTVCCPECGHEFTP